MADVKRPVLKYFGGKWAIAPWIISNFPPHRIYVEPFGGGASVLMRKPRAYSEVYNDIDGEIVNVFKVLQAEFPELSHKLKNTPFAREEYDTAFTPTEDRIERARRTLVRSHMGMGDATTAKYKPGFRARSEHSGTSKSDDWASWVSAVDAFRDRLIGVVIENRDAQEVMRQQDGTNTLHFVDPPYVHEERTSANNYRHEMTNADHEKLCEFLASLVGMVVLCGYRNPTYDRLGWETVDRKANADGGASRVETIWINQACSSAQSQVSMFSEAK